MDKQEQLKLLTEEMVNLNKEMCEYMRSNPKGDINYLVSRMNEIQQRASELMQENI